MDEKDATLIAESGIEEDVTRVRALAEKCRREGIEAGAGTIDEYDLTDYDYDWICEQMGRALTSWERTSIA